MTASTLTRSAYPTSVDDLIPHARDYAAELAALPTRNQLMKRFRVGAPKAKALLAALTATPDATTPPVADAPQPRPIVMIEDEAGHHVDLTVSAETAPALVDTALDDVPVITDRRNTPDFAAALLTPVSDPDTKIPPADAAVSPAEPVRRPVTWPVLILCLPAFVAIWGGWVEMGRLTGFGMVQLLPGIADSVQLNSAITLPISVETYAAFALYVWLSGRATGDARTFAKWSALASLGLGALGQVAYHLMAAAGWTSAPWLITAAVACIPVAVLGMGAALAHLMHQK